MKKVFITKRISHDFDGGGLSSQVVFDLEEFNESLDDEVSMNDCVITADNEALYFTFEVQLNTTITRSKQTEEEKGSSDNDAPMLISKY